MAVRRFLDYNGSGNLDSQDLVTGVALGASGKEKSNDATMPNEGDNEPAISSPDKIAATGTGCLVSIAFVLFFMSVILG